MAERDVNGECRLCLQDNCRLLHSHIIPRWVFKRVLETDTPGGHQPITVGHGRLHFDSDQHQEHLLCSSCEARFSVIEDWMSDRVYSKAGEPIPLKLLGSRGLQRAGILLRELDENLDSKMLLYFSSSIFWRSSVSRQSKAGSIHLGRYEEEFRRYLLDEDSFPRNARMIFTVMDSSGDGYPGLHNSFMFPQTVRKHGYHSHLIALGGVDFELFVGAQNVSKFDKLCLHHADVKVAIVENWRDSKLARDAIEKVNHSEASGPVQRYLDSH